MMEFGLFEHAFMQRALLAGILVAVLAGLLGVFLVLRQMSLMGDGLAHVSFAGIAVGLASGFYPLGMALVFSIVGAVVMHLLRTRGIVKGDTAMGILFTAGLAIGIVVISASKGFVNTNSYLFGNILAIQDKDLYVVLGVGTALVALLIAFYKEFFSMTFSEEAARVTGLPVNLLNLIFVTLTAATIVVSSRIVGVLLVSALLIVPAAAALQIARSFRVALILSVAFGVTSAIAGIALAAHNGWAVGGTIALCALAIFVLTIPARAMMAKGAGH